MVGVAHWAANDGRPQRWTWSTPKEKEREKRISDIYQANPGAELIPLLVSRQLVRW